jgi:hypothetical protein
MVIPTTISVISTLCLFLILNFFIKDKNKLGILITFSLLLFFTYGHVFNMMLGLRLCEFVYLILRSHRNFDNFTKVLNIIAIVLVSASISNIILFKMKIKTSTQFNYANEILDLNSLYIENADRNTKDTPDIYYIIFDRYSNSEILEEIYNFDNSQIINYLINKGFYVASESRANYISTTPSLASSLNMGLLDNLSEKVGVESLNLVPLFSLLEDYNVWHFLKSKGYTFIHLGSSFQPTTRNQYADLNFYFGRLSEFNLLLLKTTILYSICEKLGIYDSRLEHWERIIYNFNKLYEIPDLKEPTFVFAHLLIPHTPFVFDRNGNFLPKEVTDKRSRNHNYLEQLIFLNKKIEELVDNILKSSETPPIIILQGDEGSFPERLVHEGKKFNWKKASSTEIKQKFSILNAYYLPNADKSALYPSISPVNSFRLIFNIYFNANFELLKDESYVNESKLPYKFFKVTDKIMEN